MIKFNAKDWIELIKSSNHDVFKDIKVIYKSRLLRILALYKLFTKKKTQDQLNELIFQIRRFNNFLNYCRVNCEKIYFDFWLVKP